MGDATLSPPSKPDPELTSIGGWLVVAAVSIISFLLVGSTLASLGVYLPVLQADFGWSEQQLGNIAAAMLVGLAVSSIAAGWVLNKIGPRNLLFAGIVVTASGAIWAANAANLAQLTGAMAIIGAGVGAATIIPGATVINRWFLHHRGMAMAFFIGSIVVASAAMPTMTDMIIRATDWRTALTVFAGTAFVVGVGLSMLVRFPPPREPVESGELEGESEESLSGMTVVEGLTYSRFWLLILALILVQLSINGILYNVIGYLIAQGYSSGNAVSIYSIANLFGLPGLFLCGFLADRYGAARVIPVAALVLALGTFALLPVDAGDWFALPVLGTFVILWGMASGIPSQIGPIILAELVGMRAFPTLMGIKGALVSLVGALAPIATGALFTVQGSYHLPFMVSGLLAVVAVPMFVLANKGARKPA